jgi:hypothetical protein
MTNPLKVATQPSLWDSENLEQYKELYIHPKWENWTAFDPSFRWTWREERVVRRKVDWTIMVRVQLRLEGKDTDITSFGHSSCLQP